MGCCQSSQYDPIYNDHHHLFSLNESYNYYIIERAPIQTFYPEIQYEELTKTIRYKQKFIIQEQALTYYKTIFLSNSKQSSMEIEEDYDNANSMKQKQEYLYEIKSQFNQLDNYKQSIEVLQQQCEIEKISFNEKSVRYLSLPIGSGSQGSVTMNLIDINSDEVKENVERKLFPIATKLLDDQNQFIRESSILLKLNKNVRPIIVFVSDKKQEINMELCVCTLSKFKEYIHKNQLLSDQLLCKVLFSLLNISQDILLQGIFHGDIKPENIAVVLRNGEIEFVFIDYGASSWDKQDYLNFYTPAYCDKQIYSLVTNGQILNEDQIRHAEFFSISRTIQNFMLNDDQQELFKFTNINQFVQRFESKFPTTIQLLKVILLNQQEGQISSKVFDHQRLYYSSFINNPFEIDIQNLYKNISILSSL